MPNRQRCRPSRCRSADQDAQVVRLGGRVERQDVEQVGQAPVALAQDAKRLEGQLGEDAHAATLQVRPEHLRHAQVRAPRLPGVEQAEQVVEVEDVPALLGRAEDRQEPVFPLAHERHARDQPLGGQQPDVLAGAVGVLPAGDRAEDVLVDQCGLADQPRAQHQDRPAVVRAEQPGQLGDLAVAADRPVEIVGIEPVEAAPDALQLTLAFEDRLPTQRRPARILFLRRRDASGPHLVDRQRRDPRLARDRQCRRADEAVLVLALARPEILGQDLGGAGFEPFAARDLEPGAGQARCERQPSPQRLERRDQEPRSGTGPPQLDDQVDPPRFDLGAECPLGELVVPVPPAQFAEVLAQVGREQVQGSLQAGIAARRCGVEERADLVRPPLPVGRVDRPHVDWQRDRHDDSSVQQALDRALQAELDHPGQGIGQVGGSPVEPEIQVHLVHPTLVPAVDPSGIAVDPARTADTLGSAIGGHGQVGRFDQARADAAVIVESVQSRFGGEPGVRVVPAEFQPDSDDLPARVRQEFSRPLDPTGFRRAVVRLVDELPDDDPSAAPLATSR